MAKPPTKKINWYPSGDDIKKHEQINIEPLPYKKIKATKEPDELYFKIEYFSINNNRWLEHKPFLAPFISFLADRAITAKGAIKDKKRARAEVAELKKTSSSISRT